MYLKTSSTIADILNILADCKQHTLQEIANKVEISKSTAQRHIKSLSYRFPIISYSGGNIRGGVKLIDNSVCNGVILTKEQLQLLKISLGLLQKSGEEYKNNKELHKLINIFTFP